MTSSIFKSTGAIIVYSVVTLGLLAIAGYNFWGWFGGSDKWKAEHPDNTAGTGTGGLGVYRYGGGCNCSSGSRYWGKSGGEDICLTCIGVGLSKNGGRTVIVNSIDSGGRSGVVTALTKKGGYEKIKFKLSPDAPSISKGQLIKINHSTNTSRAPFTCENFSYVTCSVSWSSEGGYVTSCEEFDACIA